MGGSGHWSIDPGDLSKLEKVASEAMKPAQITARKNVFLSFSSTDLNQVNLLRGQARNEHSELEFNDWSLKEPFNSANADYIKRGITERIRQSSVTLVFIGDKTHASEWVDWEIRTSIAMGKRVIAMHVKSGVRLPVALKELGVQSIPWSHVELRKAIVD